MIALIKLDKTLMQVAEATKLQLQFTILPYDKVAYYDGKLTPNQNNYHKSKADCIFDEETGKYTFNGEVVPSYYLCDSIPDHLKQDSYALCEEKQLVNLENFYSSYQGEFRVLQMLPETNKGLDGILPVLKQLEERTDKLAAVVDALNNFSFNEKCNAHVGGGLITTYNRVKLLEDSCTDTLQEELTKGWRIITCCVQPDSRRPDYVLGKFDPEPGLLIHAARIC